MLLYILLHPAGVTYHQDNAITPHKLNLHYQTLLKNEQHLALEWAYNVSGSDNNCMANRAFRIEFFDYHGIFHGIRIRPTLEYQANHGLIIVRNASNLYVKISAVANNILCAKMDYFTSLSYNSKF